MVVAQGVTATTGEQIGQAVGVSARTVWRYFPSKENCVSPLLSAGIERMADGLREWRPGQSLEEALTRDPATGGRLLAGPEPATLGALVRLTRTEPGLRAVWLQTYYEAEPAFARALADRAGLPPDDLRCTIRAAMFNAALRAAVEQHAWRGADPRADKAATEAELAAAVRLAFAVAEEGLS
ncbi:TetR/AcrR family transcriptional regulator [Streptomyces sp. Tue 6430]|nr:TetR/AcrR family transcriptional regulator [Streptomyces sp. Tue 6430]